MLYLNCFIMHIQEPCGRVTSKRRDSTQLAYAYIDTLCRFRLLYRVIVGGNELKTEIIVKNLNGTIAMYPRCSIITGVVNNYRQFAFLIYLATAYILPSTRCY